MQRSSKPNRTTLTKNKNIIKTKAPLLWGWKINTEIVSKAISVFVFYT